MSIDICNGYLETMASLNEGADHACKYLLEELDSGVDLQAALQSDFIRREQTWREMLIKAGKTPVQQAWAVELTTIADDWQDTVGKAATHWFFEQAWSPDPKGKWSKHNVVISFLDHLKGLVGSGTAFEVQVSECMQPDVFWQAFAFTREGSNWLLQFGWSD